MSDEFQKRSGDDVVEPLFSALSEGGDEPAPPARVTRPPDPTLKWKLFGVALFLVALALLIAEQAF
jgi:hypothetical protein